MEEYLRSLKGIDGAADETELNVQAQVSAFEDLSMIFQGHMDTIANESDAVIFRGRSYEPENVLVPPSESEDCDLNDSVLKYISEILMEEDVEKESLKFQESEALRASEKLFYEVLQEKMAPSPIHHEVPDIDQSVENQYENYEDHFSIPEITDTITDEYPFLNWITSPQEYPFPGDELTAIVSESASRIPEITGTTTDEYPFLNLITSPQDYPLAGDELTAIVSESASRIPEITDTITDEYPFLNWITSLQEYSLPGDELTSIGAESASRSFQNPSSIGISSSSTPFDGSIIFPDRMLEIPSIFSDSDTMMQFNKGVEEARKFLPVVDSIVISARPFQLQEKVQVERTRDSETDVDNHGSNLSHHNLRTRKYHNQEDVVSQEGRRNKQPAVFTESMVGPEAFDMVLLRDGEQTGSPPHETLNSGDNNCDPKVFSPKGSSGGKSRGKMKKGGRRNAVNLKELLISCAQAVASEDISTAKQFLKEIREHSSPTGDGMQRLAHYLAKGLEARISGTGNNIKALAGLPPSASDVLMAYRVYLCACPFRRVSNFFSNKTIMNVSEKSTRLHIIHFGILYGFQWPAFMQRLSSRPGGPPKLQITGIDVPRPGLKPAERVEETGRRLANYARKYNVPFQFNAIAQNWETIKIEDLKLEEGEVLAVNCLYRMRILYDETVMASSPRVNNPRNNVLNLIRKTNPDVFVLGVVNGTYNAPFFITRFREALFHFYSIFDMLDANIPSETSERINIEKLMFGRQAINAIACEGGDRVERPETYKQWQVRNIRAGLSPLPLNEEIVETAMEHVKISYHKDFSIIADGPWLVQGWRGRNLFAVSSWKSVK